MGKTKGKNGFFFYMTHKQQVLKRQGEDLSINSPRLQQLAGDEWKAMNAEEREPFTRRSKNDKDRSRGQTIDITPASYSQQQVNHGRQLEAENNQLDEEEDQKLYLDKIIECCIKACKTGEDLLTASFFVISSNVMVRTDSNEFIPLEIGISQYAIKDGIKFTFHQFIDAGKVPIGYMSQAKQWAETTHKIPLDNFYGASNNYQKIVEDMVQILEESRFTNDTTGSPTPRLVYCAEDQIEQNRGVLEWLAKKYRCFMPSFAWDLEVLDLTYLLYHISNSVSRPITLALAEDMLTTSAFDYSADTNCDFHEEQDNKNCARGGARRYCYILSNNLCQMFDVIPTKAHLPPVRDGVLAESYKLHLSEVKLPPAKRYHHNNDEQAHDRAPASSTSTQPTRNESSASRTSVPMAGIGRGRAWNRTQH